MTAINLDDPRVIQTFGENLDLCLRLTGSKIEAFSLLCNLSHHMLKGFKNKLGRLNERDLAVMCETLGVPREHLLHRYQSPTAAQGAFEEIFQKKGRLTASSLLGGTNTQNGECAMGAKGIALSPAQLNDAGRKYTFGSNVMVCLGLLQKSAESLSIRTEIPLGTIEMILDGTVSLSNDVIDTIAEEIYLPANALLTDYGSDGAQYQKLQWKLQEAGRIPTEKQAEAEVEVLSPKPVEETAPPASTVIVEESETPTQQEATMAEATPDIWNSEDNVATINGRTFKLRDKTLRAEIAERIRVLKEEKYSNDTWTEFFARVDTKRTQSWLNNLRVGSATIDGTDIDTFAEFFKISDWAMLTGEFEEKPAVPGPSWDADGLIATDSATGQTFNLGDETLRQEIVGRVIRLCPAGLTLDELLVKCQIEQSSSWLYGGQLEESDIEAFAEYFKVTEYVFLSGEGLVLPEPEEAIEDEVLPALPTDTTSEPPHAEVLEAEVGAVPLAEEPAALAVVAEITDGTVAAAHQLGDELALQDHFRKLITSGGIEPANGVTWSDLFKATHEDDVDWCRLYFSLTKDGVATLQPIRDMVSQLAIDNGNFGQAIVSRVLSLAIVP